MAAYLAGHQDICFSSRKEPIFFGGDLDHRWKTETLEQYRSYFEHYNNERYVAEGSVWYLYSKSAAKEIAQFNRDAKILILLRNPLEMIVSLHRQFVSTSNEHVPQLEKALELEKERQKGLHIGNEAHFPKGLLYREVVSFHDQVERYFDTFGRENVHVTLFDDLKADSLGAFNTTLTFLGLEQVDQLTKLGVHNKAGFQCNTGWAKLDQIIRRPPWIVDWGLDRLPAIKRIAKLAMGRVNQFSSSMSDRTRQELQSELSPGISRLESLIDRDLSNWNRAMNAESSPVASGDR